jgi:hypothetical protein
MMREGRLNIIVGGIAILVGAVGGFCLGFSMEPYFENGFYAMTLPRLLLKAGHTHGMPFALYNLIIGALLPQLTLGVTGKKWCSILSILAFIMPLGLILRGVTDGAMTFAPVVLLGAVCFLLSIVLLIIGAAKQRG